MIRSSARPYHLLALLVCLMSPVVGHAEDDIAARAAVCAACHGENGVPVDSSIPVIWGQRQGYLYLQLRDFKRGARSNEQMAAVVADMDRTEMMALAGWFSEKPWPDLQQPRAREADARQAETVAGSAGCPGCHIDAYHGDSTNPRLAGQSHDYLRKTMAAFRSGERTNNGWMVALLKTYSDSDIDALATYLAGL